MPSFEHTYGNVRVKVFISDITKLKVDAIAKSANTLTFMDGGVAGAINLVGEAKIETEALKKAPVKMGGAIVKTVGKLPVKFVIHAPIMISL